jgi:uncharacterized coiled-coil protein SlyX
VSLSRKLVIKHHNPLHIFAVIVISCAVITITTWVLLDESQWSYIKSRLTEANKNKELWQDNQGMNNTIVKLEDRIIMLERTAQLDRQTIENLQGGMIKQQDEVYTLKKELEFYQGIMAAAGEFSGLSIQGLRIEATSQPRSYYFKLILTHVSKSDKIAAGRLSILLEGVQDDTPRTIDILELTLSRSLPLVFKFSSFERIEGSIMLPDGFVAHRVIVRARQEGKKMTPEIERIFDWTEAMEY